MIVLLDTDAPPGWTERTLRERRRELREEQIRRLESVRETCRVAEKGIRAEIAGKMAALRQAK